MSKIRKNFTKGENKMKRLNKKIVLALGTVAAVVTPIAAVVACGSEKNHSIAVGSYSNLMIKLDAGDITIAGAWGDSRFYAPDKGVNIKAIGVNKKRVANDGIQVREGIPLSDQFLLQELFIELINDSKTNEKLQIDLDNKMTSIFSIYSHDGYTPIRSAQKIGVMSEGILKETDMLPDGVPAVDVDDKEFFSGVSDVNNKFAKFATKKAFNIIFIPSSDASLVKKATDKLQKFLETKGIKTNISISTDYDTAATSLKSKTVDVAFLPVDTWNEGTSNSNFILQAARGLQINSLDVSNKSAKISTTELTSEVDAVKLFNKYGALFLDEIIRADLQNADDGIMDGDIPATDSDTTESNPFPPKYIKFFEEAKKDDTLEQKIFNFAKAEVDAGRINGHLSGSYESWIYAKKSSSIYKSVVNVNSNEDWKLDMSDDIVYGYTSTTSSSSFIFPEDWFAQHFNGFESLI